jgi:hypothetical protein
MQNNEGEFFPAHEARAGRIVPAHAFDEDIDHDQ